MRARSTTEERAAIVKALATQKKMSWAACATS